MIFKFYTRTSPIRGTKNCLCEVVVWFSGSHELTIKTYSWFFTKVYKAVLIFLISSPTPFWRDDVQNINRYQPIGTDLDLSEWILVVNNCYVYTVCAGKLNPGCLSKHDKYFPTCQNLVHPPCLCTRCVTAWIPILYLEKSLWLSFKSKF